MYLNVNIFESIENLFSFGMSWQTVINTYWFLFFVEFPRYYLLDFLVVFWRMLFYRENRKRKEAARYKLYISNPLVSILVPGKNEGKHIFKLVQSLREQTYRNYEIIVVDDGSDDATPLICRDLQKCGYIDKYLRLRERGGKAAAANFGALYASGKYIVHLDADSSLDRDAVEKILLPFFYDEKIMAVGGTVKVRNADDSVCASLQAIEYLKTIQVGRMVTSTLGIYHIISGAFGAFDREFLKRIGFWGIGPGLDGDITQKIRKAGFKVYFAEDAVCMTNVPVKWYNLFKQRLRWSKSLVRFRVRKHKDILLPNRNFRFSNFVSNFENIVYDLVLNYLWLVYIFGLLFTQTDNLLNILLVGWIIRMCFSLLSAVTIGCVSERAFEEVKLFRYLILNTFYTGYFLRITRLVAYTMEIFFFSSYKDNWNPKKTSETARIEDM